MNVTYICTKNNSILNFVKGQKFTVEQNSPEEEFFRKSTEYFDVVYDEGDIWKVGDFVSLSGGFTNLTHPSKNGSFNRGQTLVAIPAQIKEIRRIDNSHNSMMMFATADGTIYSAKSISLVKEISSNIPGHHYPCVKPLPMYWFINSKGTVHYAIIGKDEEADSWRKVSGNYFNTKEAARDYRENCFQKK